MPRGVTVPPRRDAQRYSFAAPLDAADSPRAADVLMFDISRAAYAAARVRVRMAAGYARARCVIARRCALAGARVARYVSCARCARYARLRDDGSAHAVDDRSTGLLTPDDTLRYCHPFLR